MLNFNQSGFSFKKIMWIVYTRRNLLCSFFKMLDQKALFERLPLSNKNKKKFLEMLKAAEAKAKEVKPAAMQSGLEAKVAEVKRSDV